MFNSTKLLIAVIASVLGLGILSVSAQETALPPEITDITCSIGKSCPEGLECFTFPEIGLRCAQPDPCSYYQCPEDTKCGVLEIYPGTVNCASTVGEPGAPEYIETVEHAIGLDENVQPQDLGVGDPKILPDSPFYFLKNLGRAIQSLITFDPLKKTELSEKFASEKLMELKKMIEQKKSQGKIDKAIDNYQKEIEKSKEIAEKIKEKVSQNEEVGKFLDKFVQQQVLHQRILEKLESQVPPETLEKIKAARERHLEKFGEVMTKLEDRKEMLQEKLEKNLEELKGSEFKSFKNLEILKQLEEKVPEEAKEAIQKAEGNVLKRLQGDLEKMPSENQERFKEYIEEIGGDKEKQLEILEDMKTKIKEAPETSKILKLKEKLEEGTTKIFEKIKEKAGKVNCPVFSTPTIECPGTWVIEKSLKGCPLTAKCIILEKE